MKKDTLTSEKKESEFNPSEFIVDHVSDSHEWHILTKKNGENVAIYLPVILYDKARGLSFFLQKSLPMVRFSMAIRW